MDLAAEERAIRRLTEHSLAAENRRDVDAVMALYADDAIAVYGGRLLSGRAAIRQDLEEALAAKPGLVQQWQITEVRISTLGDMASEIGTYEATQNGATRRGFFFTVFHKRDGRWRIVQDMLTPARPAAPPSP